MFELTTKVNNNNTYIYIKTHVTEYHLYNSVVV